MAWWSKPKEPQLDAEVRFHIDSLTEANIEAGLSPREARRKALLDFGGPEQVKEDLRDVYRLPVLETAVANLRYAVRFIRKSPSFSITVILTLGLGIGANSAVFSAIDAILIRPLPFPNGGQLMRLGESRRKNKAPDTFVAPVRLEDWNRLNSTFQAITGYYTENESETSGPLPEKLTRAWVAPRFLQVWGISPALGRGFSSAEEHFGGPNAVLISDRLWRRRFGAEPNAAGKWLRFGKSAATIVGVMPASFLFPDREVDLWSPVPIGAPYTQSRESTWFIVTGRLKPDVAVEQARADLATVQAQLGKQFPKSDANLEVVVEPLKDSTVGKVRASLWLLFGSVSLLLLIACTNIAALLLARGAQRRQEISIRFSLGASRATVAGQLLTEVFVLALIGSVLGLLIAAEAAKVFRMMAANLPRVEEVRLDWRIVLYSLACSLIATFLCGLIPALRGTRSGLASSLSQTVRTQVSARSPLQWLLSGVQVALAVILLSGAGLLLRSFQELGRVAPGFDPSHVLTLHISASWGETGDIKGLERRIDRILDGLRSVPGVEAAATSGWLPGVPAKFQMEVQLNDGSRDPSRKILADNRVVSQGYFETMRIPMLAGEPCRAQLHEPVVVVNRSFANAFLNGSRGIGRRLAAVNNSFLAPGIIAGIASDAREQGLNQEPAPTVYWCMSAPTPDPYYLVRTHGEPAGMAETLRLKIHEIEPGRSVFGISPLEQQLSDAFSQNRLRAELLAFFALTAVALACIGLYGTLSYFVNERRREVGLRLALGAVRSQILAHFLLQGISISLIGAVAGLAMAAAFTRLLAGMLYGVQPWDGPTLAMVALLVLAVGTIASFVPAVRASRVEPMQVLRDE